MMNFEDKNECCNHCEPEGQAETVKSAVEKSSCAQAMVDGELALCKENLAKAQEKYIYLNADFENFRRNMTKERAQWTRSAQTKIFEDLISVIDDFGLAIADFQKQTALQDAPISEGERSRFQGIELVYKNFIKFLDMHGITEVPTSGAFNPTMHEALVQVADESKKSGEIVAVLQKGYMHKEVVLRPAKVSVAQ